VSKVSKNWVVKNGWLVGLALLLVSTLTFVQAQKGLEEQLAGVRLGAQFIDYDEEGRLKPDCLLAIYGMPDYIIGIGRDAAPAQPGLKPPTPPEVPGIPIAEERIEIPGGIGARQPIGRGGLAFPGPFGKGVTLRIGIPVIPGTPPEALEALRASYIQNALGILGMYGTPTILSMMGTPIERIRLIYYIPNYLLTMPGTGARGAGGTTGVTPTLPGTGVRGAEGTTGVTRTFPNPEELAWVIPPFVQLDTNEVYFVYRRQGAHLNFLMELTGTEGRKEFRVVAITVAGRRYDGAQTAKGDPFKSIKLGDDLQRVLLRYGQPDEIVYYNPLTLQVANTPTRNLILRYHRTSNIEFTTLENKVVRIFIFLPRQVTFIR
jgi:hypothetical protein